MYSRQFILKYFHTKLRNLSLNGSKSTLSQLTINNKIDHIELCFRDVNDPELLKNLKFDSHWLRMNCHSIQSKQPSTGQRTIDLNTIPAELKIERVEIVDENKELIIKWNLEAKQVDTRIPIDFLLKNCPTSVKYSARDKFENCKKLQFFDYNKMIGESTNRDEIFKWLFSLAKYGVCVVKNLPIREGMVKKLAEIIAPVQNTIYGEIFDVKVDQNPINIAYSNVPLELHMDLMYYESSPGLQFLHCLKFDDDICGGESIFLDAFEAGEEFREMYPEHFTTLSKIPATFHKIHIDRSRPVLMVYRRPHIVLNHRGRLNAVNWSPPFEGPLTEATMEEVKAYYAAYFRFAKFLNSNPKMLEYRLKPGEVACFNNRRVLHGRKGFENTQKGIRHFQGCYVNIDEFKSEVYANEFFKSASRSSKANSIFLNDLKAHKFMYGNHDYD